MRKCTPDSDSFPRSDFRDHLTDVLRQGAQRMLAEFIEAEVEECIQVHASLVDADGHRLVVRNGHMPERKIQSAIGALTVRETVHDNCVSGGRECPFGRAA